jgi:hypothetical protein
LKQACYYNFRADGLGMRIRAIDTIAHLRETLDIQTHAYWGVNDQCPLHFLDMFENVYDIKFNEKKIDPMPEGGLSFESGRTILREFVNQENLKKAGSGNLLSKNYFKKSLTPVPEIKKIALSLIDKYKITKDVIGIHLRVPEGFDYKKEPSSENRDLNNRGKLTIKSLNIIENSKLLKDYRVLFASDSKKLTYEMISKYSNFFHIEEEIYPDHSRFPPVRGGDSLEMALAIAFALSSTNYRDKIRLPSTSAYSQLPELLCL